MLRRNRNAINTRARQIARNSMLDDGSAHERIIQITFAAGCFHGKDVRHLDSRHSLSVYNFLCSLFSFSVREFDSSLNSRTILKPNILVLIDATKIPLKALRIILRACQSALAYKIRQAIIVEPEGLFGQQRAGIDVMLDCYDFKTIICPKSKLWKYFNAHEEIYDSTLKRSKAPAFTESFGWLDIKQEFYNFFTKGPTYCGDQNALPNIVLTTSSIILAKFLKKDNSVIINLVENDLDTISIRNILKNKNGMQRKIDCNYSTINSKKNTVERGGIEQKNINIARPNSTDNEDREVSHTKHLEHEDSSQPVKLLPVQTTQAAKESLSKNDQVLVGLKKPFPEKAKEIKAEIARPQKYCKIKCFIKNELDSDGFGIETPSNGRQNARAEEIKIPNENTLKCLKEVNEVKSNIRQFSAYETCTPSSAPERAGLLIKNEAPLKNNIGNSIEQNSSEINKSSATETEELNKEDLNFFSIISEKNRIIEEILKWICETAEPKLAEIEAKGLVKTQPCCSDDESPLNDNSSSESIKHCTDKLQMELTDNTEKIVDKCAELNESIENLFVEKSNRYNEIEARSSATMLKMLDEEMENLKNKSKQMSIKVYELRTKIKHLEVKIINCVRFRRGIVKFYKESDKLLRLICAKENVALRIPDVQAESNSLKKQMINTEESLNFAIEVGTTFCTIIYSSINSNSSNHCKHQLENDENMAFVTNNLKALSDRWKRCGGLVKLRMARIKKLEEIIKCEEFGKQIAEKIGDCVKYVPNDAAMDNKNTKTQLYEYGKQLIYIAFVLRRLNGQELQTNVELKEKLESTWQKLNSTFSCEFFECR